MPECEANVPRNLGGIVNLTMSEQYIRAVRLAAQREDLAAADFPHALRLATGVLDRPQIACVPCGPLWVLMA